MSTITLAKIYEKQGHFEDAYKIYKDLLEQDPSNKELQKALKRVSGSHSKILLYFSHMNTKEEFDKFERWLMKPWS